MQKDIKIQLPENIGDITLEQSQKYLAIVSREDIINIEKTKRIIKLFTGLNRKEVELIDIDSYNTIVAQINKALDSDVEFKHRFFLGAKEFGFVPNLDEITAGEYIDLSTYGTSPENLHKVMSVLFRPIVLDDSYDNYEIETYSANSEYAEIMKDAPMNIVNGMLVFFCLLSSELQLHILKSTEVAQAEARLLQVITSKNGAGTQR